jgi:ribonucleoside-diphosphate reductase beta chain
MLKTKETEKRWSIFPILHNDLWDFYKKAESQTWVAEEIDLSEDKFDELTPSEQVYLKNLLAFFAISDGIVLENINDNLLENSNILEAQYYYNHQSYIEQVHANTYALLVDTFIKDRSEQDKMYNAISKIEAVSKKAQWALQWFNSDSYAHRLVAFACIEGLAFSSTFAGIFYFRSRGKMPGLCEANELIMNDENSHYEFATHLYHNYLKDEHKLKDSEIRKIVLDCYETEKIFVEDSMPSGLLGLSKDDMITYVQFVTDTVLVNYGLEPEFKVKSPLKYMDRIALKRKTNFFEKRQTEYTRVDVPTDKKDMFDNEF